MKTFWTYGMARYLRSWCVMFCLGTLTLCHGTMSIQHHQDDAGSDAFSLTDIEYDLIIAPVDGKDSNIPLNTKAYNIITYIFGSLDSTPGEGALICMPSKTQPCSPLMGNLFGVFNSGLLVLATLLLSHVIFQSAFSDASQGLAAGQKYSHDIIPLRAALGMGLLIPTKTGFCLSQILIAKLLLLGSSAATGLWQYLLMYHDMTGDPIGSEGLGYKVDKSKETGNIIAENFVKNMTALAVCDAYCNTPVGRNTIYSSGNAPPLENAFGAFFDTTNGPNNYKINTVAAGASENVCGQISFGPMKAGELAIFSNYKAQIEALAYAFVEDYNALSDPLIFDITFYLPQFTILKNLLKNDLMFNSYKIAQDAANPEGTILTKNARQASEWFDAPTYFFDLLSAGKANYDLSLNVSLSARGQTVSTDPKSIFSWAKNATDFSKEAVHYARTNLKVSFAGNSGATKDFQGQMENMLSATDSTGDALLGLSRVGRSFFALALDLMIVSFTFSFMIVVLTGVASDYVNVTTFGLMTAIITLIIAVIQVMGFLIPIASVLAIGLPLIPLITYTSAIITWIFFAVIAITGAPIMCIGLISHGDSLGKAAPALMILMNLFMRPSLNVIGLVAGSKLFNIFYLFFTQGYILAVNDIMGTIGVDDTSLMSIMSIIFLYVYTFFISSGCARCYSLIYMLPDRFLTWVGAQAVSIPDSTQGLQASQRSLQVSSQNVQEKFKEFNTSSQKIFDQSVAEANKKFSDPNYKGPRDFQGDLVIASQKIKASVVSSRDGLRGGVTAVSATAISGAKTAYAVGRSAPSIIREQWKNRPSVSDFRARMTEESSRETRTWVESAAKNSTILRTFISEDRYTGMALVDGTIKIAGGAVGAVLSTTVGATVFLGQSLYAPVAHLATKGYDMGMAYRSPDYKAPVRLSLSDRRQSNQNDLYGAGGMALIMTGKAYTGMTEIAGSVRDRMPTMPSRFSRAQPSTGSVPLHTVSHGNAHFVEPLIAPLNPNSSLMVEYIDLDGLFEAEFQENEQRAERESRVSEETEEAARIAKERGDGTGDQGAGSDDK